MRIARVFPRKTKASPTDDMAFFGPPPMWGVECDEVHISVAFTWDIPKAEQFEKEWRAIAPVKIGGPALGTKGGDFVTGRYLAPGYVITSRGCDNKCWFCSVWKREGVLRELPITDGWNVLDDNLLACSETHIRSVFQMLGRQKHRAVFSGGLEAKKLRAWHVELLCKIRARQMFFAYDTPNDFEPLVDASKMLRDAGFGRHKLYSYVLIGYPKDTFDKAEKRLTDVLGLGISPFAMLYRDRLGGYSKDWRRFQKRWCRPAAIFHSNKDRSDSELFAE